MWFVVPCSLGIDICACTFIQAYTLFSFQSQTSFSETTLDSTFTLFIMSSVLLCLLLRNTSTSL